MKLSLSSQDGVQILGITGSVDAHNMDVLKAGITKILRAGKNRIVLSFDQGTDTLSNEMIREVAILDLFAKELSGTIVLACANDKLRQGIINFSKPPVITILPSVEAAVSFFRATNVEAEEPASPEDLKAALAEKQKEVDALNARVALLDPSELQRVRHEKAELEAKNGLLEEQLAELMRFRRSAPGLEAYEQKVLLLEGELAKLTGQVQKEKK